MTEIVPGIYRLKLPMPNVPAGISHINAYLIKGTEGHLLVHTGCNTEESFSSLKNQLGEIQVKLADISRIVLTHLHPDHFGLTGELRKFTDAEISFHQLEHEMTEIRYYDIEDRLNTLAEWLRINGVPADILLPLQNASVDVLKYVSPTAPDTTLHGGEIISTGIFTFRVLWSPGHSPGHICLYEKDRKLLVSGDHILPAITPNVGRHPQSGDNPLGSCLQSLEEIRQLDIDIALPGHGSPFSGIKASITALIRHHRQRNAHVLKELGGAEKTGYQITTGIKWQNNLPWQQLAALHQRLALLETLFHLKYLETQGKVTSFTQDKVIYYRQT